MNLRSKVAIVIGGNSGIGMAIVLELAKQGANIVIDCVEEPPGDRCSMRINIDNQDSNQTSRLRTHA